MSDYEYHEFCRLYKPMTPKIRSVMDNLSSRAAVGTHNAFYEYNYGSFRGDSEELLRKYFDVYFFFSNYGIAKLLFKYQSNEVDWQALKKESENNVVECTKSGKFVYVNIRISLLEAGGYIEGEGWLPEILPIYDEIKEGDYRIFRIAKAGDRENEDEPAKMPERSKMSKAQERLLESMSYCF